eukprot:c12030_g1_i4.p1 GENE.c12030_g1_i4~~c12030_g1_i4.p1  ORF type:complete len:211 (+),score=30.87 c12030_g1_i4:421-1053(+)
MAGDKQNHPAVHLASSVSSGLITSTIGCPLWVIKTRLQLQTNKEIGYKHAGDCLVRIIREEGVGTLFRGLSASYWGISEMAIQFLVYEQLKQLALPPTHSSLVGSTDTDSNSSLANLSPARLLLSAAAAKLLAVSITYPHEVVRTRVREVEWPQHVKGFFSALRYIAVTDGWRALYRGIGVHVMRSVPNAAIMFATYESVCHMYRKFQIN